MKLNIFRRLFVEDYQDVPKGDWFGNLLNNLNQFIDQVVTTLRNGVTFQDNFRGDIKTLSFVSNTELQVGTSFNTTPFGIQVFFVDGAMLTGWKWRSIKPGLIGITLQLSDTKSHNATVAIFS